MDEVRQGHRVDRVAEVGSGYSVDMSRWGGNGLQHS